MTGPPANVGDLSRKVLPGNAVRASLRTLARGDAPMASMTNIAEQFLDARETGEDWPGKIWNDGITMRQLGWAK